MKYQGKGNIREYIMSMSNIVFKLKALKLEISEDLLIHLVLISLPAQFNQFKVSYNCQKDKWSLNELISYCVQEEERQKQARQKVLILQAPQRLRAKERDRRIPRRKLLRVQNKRNNLKKANVSFAIRLDT